MMEFSSPKIGEIESIGDESKIIIPNPNGGAPAVIIIKREQIAQYMDDRLDAVEFNFVLKLTEEQMKDIQEQWSIDDEEQTISATILLGSKI